MNKNKRKNIKPPLTLSKVHFLNKLFSGEGFVLGPVNKDNWHVYIADFRSQKTIQSSSNQVFEVMMHDLDPEVHSKSLFSLLSLHVLMIQQ